MSSPENSVTDEIVKKAVHVYVVAPLPSEMPEWQETREAMRAALEAVWPEPTLTEYEWRLSYDPGDGAGGVFRESFGLDEKGARAALARYEANPDITELKLWRRPKPAKWECANGL